MRRLVVVSAVLLTTPVAVAQEPLTKQEIIDRSAAICRDLGDDVARHSWRAANADGWNEFARHARRYVRNSRPYVRELADLKPAEGGRRYRRFVNNTSEALDRLAAAVRAIEARRGRLAERRLDAVEEHARRAKRAAVRYGLRRSCIRYVG